MAYRRQIKHLWFPVTVVLLAAAGVPAVWAWPGDLEPGARFFTSFSIVGMAVILLTLWWLFFSGVRWLTRIGVFVALLALAGGANWAFEPEIEFDGQMNPMFHFGRPSLFRRALESHRAGTARLDTGSVAQASIEDFPEYRGNKRRDGIVAAGPLGRDWANAKEIWRQPCGGGYAGLVVVGTLAVTIEQRDDKECVVGYDAVTGH